MKPNTRRSHSRIAFLLFFPLFLVSMAGGTFAATLSGFVYNKVNRLPLPEVDVELLNENYQSLRRVRTDTSGRYTFSNLVDGKYVVRARPFRYGLQEQEFRVELYSVSITGGSANAGFYTQDFMLSPLRSGLEAAEAGVIFAQDVPKQARQNYEKAVDRFEEKKPEEGTRFLREALTIFPDYYEALVMLGKELVAGRKFPEAAEVFKRASEVNPKSAVSFYYVGYSLHTGNLGNGATEARDALKKALNLAPSSAEVALLMGKIERSSGNYREAQRYLLKAKNLAGRPHPDIQRELVQLYGNNMGEFAKAADELEAYIKASGLKGDEAKGAREVVKKLREKARAQSNN